MKRNNGWGIEKNVFHCHLSNLAVFLTIVLAEKKKMHIIALTSLTLFYGAFHMKHITSFCL